MLWMEAAMENAGATRTMQRTYRGAERWNMTEVRACEGMRAVALLLQPTIVNEPANGAGTERHAGLHSRRIRRTKMVVGREERR